MARPHNNRKGSLHFHSLWCHKATCWQPIQLGLLNIMSPKSTSLILQTQHNFAPSINMPSKAWSHNQVWSVQTCAPVTPITYYVMDEPISFSGYILFLLQSRHATICMPLHVFDEPKKVKYSLMRSNTDNKCLIGKSSKKRAHEWSSENVLHDPH